MTLEEKLSLVPDKPGVYIMKDEDNKIIYIGKAISLKNRVRQYFQSSRSHTLKVRQMVSNIRDFEYIITTNEVEALILESNLIKKHKPKYNILLKDDKHYPYIKITMGEDYPKILVAREIKKDKGKYYGPYPSSYAVNQTMEIIKNLFPIRSCTKVLPRDIGKDRPCLNFHIKRCIAPCQGKVTSEQYKEMMQEIGTFLSGRQEELIKKLEEKMNEASGNLEFEKAAQFRDQVSSLKAISERQKIIFSDLSERDVIGIQSGDYESCVYIFFIRSGKLMGGESFILTGTDDRTPQEVLSQFFEQYYSKATYIAKEILVQYTPTGDDVISQWLSSKRGSKVEVKVPLRGEKLKIIEMAMENARESLDIYLAKVKKDLEKTEGAVVELKEILGIETMPRRIEAFDISHIQGTDPVASMIVFENGKSSNKEYRRYKIRSVVGPDDYASMKEVVLRRYKKIQDNNLPYPDLIIVDGGLGQVNAALTVTDTLGIDIPVCGIVKDDKHRTRALVYNGKEINVPISSKAFRLLTSIQDEAHRFAINYHRSLRSKALSQSVLDDIPKIGDSRKKALLKHFSSIEKIKRASIEELREAKGMTVDSATAVYDYFRDNNGEGDL